MYKRTFANKEVYNNITFNSKLEADFAKYLDGVLVKYKGKEYQHSPIKWVYEEKIFELIPQENWVDRTEKDKTLKKMLRNKKHSLQKVIYTPDFYLPDYNLYIETKGFQFDDALFHLRLRLFKHKYPTESIWIVRHHDEFSLIDEVLENLKIGEK